MKFRLLCLTFYCPLILWALPQGGKASSGQVYFHSSDSQSLEIQASDRAIIHFDSFNLLKDEKVVFVQPNQTARVLGQIHDQNPSQIFGEMRANGQLFLCNPSGFYFGESAVVNTGSFIASTLKIADSDFVQDKLFFSLDSSDHGIVNKGRIEADYSIAFLSHSVINEGVIIARAGKVAVASGEKITLDFTGDGLIQFAIDEEFESSWLANYGAIEAQGGAIALSTAQAQKSIKMVVNTDGAVAATKIEMEEGCIRLVNTGTLRADRIAIEGGDQSSVAISGTVEAKGERGGQIVVTGDRIDLLSAQIDASGELKGGEILIGGDYMGSGDLKKSQWTYCDEKSVIRADAVERGEGGRVILWSDDITVFEGQIFARGGWEEGFGGFVETSGRAQLGIKERAFVDTSSHGGALGSWFLDPASINIVSGGTDSIAAGSAPNCATATTLSIDSNAISLSVTNVALCAQNGANSSITVSSPIIMNNAGVSVSLTAGSGTLGSINLNADIYTQAADIVLNGVVTVTGNVTVSSNYAGSGGADITFAHDINQSGSAVLNLDGGTNGDILISGDVAIDNLTLNNSLTTTVSGTATIPQLYISNTVTSVTFSSPLTVSTTFSILGGGYAMTLNGGTITPNAFFNNTGGTTLNGGGSNLTFVNGVSSFSALSLVTFNGNVNVSGSGASVSVTKAAFGPSTTTLTTNAGSVSLATVTLTGNTSIDTTNGGLAPAGQAIQISGAMNGAYNLTMTSGTGSGITTSTIGNLTPLNSITASGLIVSQNGNARIVGAVNYTGSVVVNFGGDLVTQGGKITVSGTGTMTASALLDTTNGGLVPAGNDISFSGQLNAQTNNLTFNAGTSGDITVPGGISSNQTVTLTNCNHFSCNGFSSMDTLILTNATSSITFSDFLQILTQLTTTASGYSLALVGGGQIPGTTTILNTGGLSLSNGSYGSIDFIQGLVYTAGTTTLLGTVRSTGTGYSLTFGTLNTSTSPATIFTQGGVVSVGNTTLGSNLTVDTTSGNATPAGANVSFSSNVNGSNLYNFIFAGGTAGDLNVSGNLSASTFNIQSGSHVTITGTSTLGTLSISNLSSSLTLNGAVTVSTFFTTAFGSYNILINNGGTITPFVSFNSSGSVFLANGTSPTLAFNGGFNHTNGTTTISGIVNAAGSAVALAGVLSGATPSTLYTSGFAVSLSTLVLTDTFTIDTTNAGAVATGAGITITGSTSGNNKNLTLTAGSSGNISFQGIGGNSLTLALGSLTASGAQITQSGAVFLLGSLNYTAPTIRPNQNISCTTGMTFTGAVTLSPSVTFSSNFNGTGSNILFTSSITGATTGLTLDAGTTGTIAINGAVNLGSLTLTNSAGMTVSGTASFTSVTLTNTTGSIDFNNTITVTSAFTTAAVGYNLGLNSGGTITPSVTFLNTGTLALSGSAISLSFGGSVTHTAGPTTIARTVRLTNLSSGIGLAAVTMNGVSPTLITNRGSISFTGALTLGSTALIDATNSGLSSAGGGITLSTIDGAFGLTLTAGSTGNTQFNAVGATTPLSSLTVTGSTLTQLSTVNTSGNVSYTSGSSSTIRGNVTTGGTQSYFGSNFLSTANVTFDSTNGGVLPAGNNITFSGVLNDLGNLRTATINAGTSGTIQLGSIVSCDTLRIVNSLNTTCASNVTVTTLNISDTVGAVTINGTLNVAGSFLTASKGYSITLNNGGTITPATTLLNTGGVLLKSTSTFTNGLTSTASTTTLQSGTLRSTNSGTAPITLGTFNVTTSASQILTNASAISIGATTLGIGLTVNATNLGAAPTGANITFSSTVNGGQPLTLTSGTTGDVTFTGIVGGTTPLAAITLSSVQNVTAVAITATALTQSAGTGTTTFNGVLTTNGVTAGSGISLTGTKFTFNQNVTTTGIGPVSITHSDVLTVANGLSFSLTGSFTDGGTGTTSFGANVTTTAQNISFNRPTTLTDNISVSAGTGVGNISFNVLNGAKNLTLNTTGGNITFSQAVGGVTRLGDVTITAANNVTAVGLKLASLTQSAGSGTTTFNGVVDLNTATGLNISARNVTINQAVTVTGTGGASIALTGVGGTLILNTGANLTLDGAFAQTGTGGVQASGSISTSNATISFASDVVVNNPTTLNSGGTGADITFSGFLDGPSSLSLAAGVGNIHFVKAIGSVTRLGVLTMSSAQNITSLGIVAQAIVQTASSGTASYTGTLDTDQSTGIQLTGNVITINGSLITAGGGPVAISNSGLLTLAAGGSTSINSTFTQSGGGGVTLSGTLVTLGDLTFGSPITLAALTTLNNGSTGTITLSDTVNGAFDLTLIAGAGNISLVGAIGGSTPPTTLTVTSVANLTAHGIIADTILQSAGSGTSTFIGALSGGVGGIALTGSAFAFNAAIDSGSNFTLANSGLATFNAAAVTTTTGNFSQTGLGSTSLATSITTQGTLTFSGNLNAVGSNALLDTSTNGTAITLSSTLNGPGDLELKAGSGNITLTGVAGGSPPLGSLTITSVADLSTAAITAADITQVAGTGTSTFGALSTSGASGISLTGNNIAQSAAVTTSGNGPYTITNSGNFTAISGATTSIDGAYTQNGTGPVALAGAIITTNDPISFDTAITLMGDASWDTGLTGGDITVGSTIDGTYDLTLNAPGHTIAINGLIGNGTTLGDIAITAALDVNLPAIIAASLTQAAGTGTTTLGGTVATSGATGVNLTGTNIVQTALVTTTGGGPFVIANSSLFTATDATVQGNYTQSGSGAVDISGTVTSDAAISLNGPVTLTGALTLDTSASNGNISLSGTVDGAQDFTLVAGSGDVLLSQAIGGNTPISVLTFSGADDVTATSLHADSISGSSLGGLFSVSGTTTTEGASGISLIGAAFTFHDVTTHATGPMTIANTGILTLSSGSTLTLDGAFGSGNGPVSLGASLTTNSAAITILGPITLIGTSRLDSGVGSHNIALSGTINGAFTLTINTGGDLSTPGVIGALTPPIGFVIESAQNIIAGAAINIDGPFTIQGFTGTATFNGPIATTTASGIDFTGAVMTFNANVTTSGGPIVLSNSGTLTIPSGVTLTSATSLTQSGGGGISFGGAIATSGTLQLGSALSLTAAGSLNSGGGAMTLAAITGNSFNLTLTGGSGDITLGGNATGLGRLSIQSARNVTATNYSGASLQQIAGTGLSHFTGTVATSGASGISLTGTQFTFDQAVSTAGTGACSVTHTGTLTLASTSSFTLAGAFTESGGGSVQSAAPITTSDQNITFNDPFVLTGPVTLDSGPGAGDITFNNTIDGPYCLTVLTGTGQAQFFGAIGSSTAIGCLSVTAPTITHAQNVNSTGAINETGNISLASTITTANSNVTLTGDVTLTGNTTISTGIGAGNIAITGTIDGDIAGRDLTLAAGTGTITTSSPIGSLIGLGSLTLSGSTISWDDLGATSVGASGSVTLNASTAINFTGDRYFGGAQHYTAPAFNLTGGATSIESNTQAITFTTGTITLSGDTSITSHGRAITLSPVLGATYDLTVNSGIGTLTVSSIGANGQNLDVVDLTYGTLNYDPSQIFANTLILTSVNPQLISSDVIVSGDIIYNTPIIFNAPSITFICNNGGNITFNESVQAASTSDIVTIQACGYNVTFNAPVGNLVPPGALIVDGANNLTFANTVKLGALTQTNGIGLTSFAAGLETTKVGGTDLTTNQISFSGTVTSMNGGGMTLDNADSLTASPATFNLSGAFDQKGAGAVTIGGSITTSDATIHFASPITLSSAFVLNTQNSTGGNITLDSTVDGAFNFTVGSGSADILLSGALGGVQALNAFQITSVRNASISTVTAASVTQNAGTGTTTLAAVTTSGSGINLTGTAFTFTQPITTGGSGGITLNNSGLFTLNAAATILTGGIFNQTGSGSNSLAGQITSGGAISFSGLASLSAALALNSATNNSPITFSNIVNGPGALTLTLGGGDLTFGAAVGNSPALGALLINSVDDVTTQSIRATTIKLVTATGITTIIGDLSTSLIGGIVLGDATVPASIGAITLNGSVVTTGSGPVSINHTGVLALTGGPNTSISAAFEELGGGAVQLAGLVKTTGSGATVTFNDAVTLVAAATVTTASSTIHFGDVINGGFGLTLSSGSADILFDGNLGQTTPLGALLVQTVRNITYPFVDASSIIQTSASGTTTINGPFTSRTVGGISITGGVITQNGTMTSFLSGPIAFQNNGLLTIGGAINSGGSFSQNGTGSVSLGANIATTNANLTFASPVTLTTTVLLNSGLGSGNILLQSTVGGGQDLQLLAGSGNITCSGALTVGNLLISSATNATFTGIVANALTQSAGTGTTQFNGIVTLSGAANLTGSAFTINNQFTTSGSNSLTVANAGVFTLTSSAIVTLGGGLTQNTPSGTNSLSGSVTAGDNISFSGVTAIAGATALDTSSNNKAISFAKAVNGPGALTLTLGSGDLTASASMGASPALGAFEIVSVGNASLKAVTASYLKQTAGSGTTTILGNITTSNVNGIDLSGTHFAITGSLITTAAGPCTIQHTNTITLVAGNSTLIDGPFLETGSGGVTLSGLIHASDADITLNNPITLAGATTLNSDGGGDIAIVSAVDGPGGLTLDSGTGNILASADFGGTTALDFLTIVATNNATFQDVTAGYILQSGGDALTLFNGSLSTSQNAGIDLTGTQFTFTNTVTTQSPGPMTIHNSALVTIGSSATMTIGGTFNQAGSGAVQLGASITAGQSLTFHGAITLTQDVILTAGSSGLSLLNTVSGAHALEITTAGPVVFSGAIGASPALTSLKVNPCASVTAAAITAGSIEYVSVNGLSSFSGALTTSAPAGISLTGSTFNFGGTITTSGGGDFTLVNSGTALLGSNRTVTLSGDLLQTGSGTLSGGGNWTSAGNMNFSGNLLLTGNLNLSTALGGGDIQFAQNVSGAFDLTISAGAGDVTWLSAIALGTPLKNLTVTSAHDIWIEEIGTATQGIQQALSLTASHDIRLDHVYHTAGSQTYSAGNLIDFIAGVQTTLTTTGGPISFTSGLIRLEDGSDLVIQTNGGDFSYVEITGTTFENISINTGSGLATINTISGPSSINNLTVRAGEILFAGPIDVVNADCEALTVIENLSGAVALDSTNNASFNALGGDVASVGNPLLVHTTNEIFAGSTYLAAFDGSSGDNTVHVIVSNPPCVIVFNGVVIKDCNTNPPAPTPLPVVVVPKELPFNVPGMDSSVFNLASDYFFLPSFLDSKYFGFYAPIYYRPNK